MGVYKRRLEIRDWKPWSCKGGHVLGQVVRDGNGVRQFLLNRNAIDPHPYKGGEFDEGEVMLGYIRKLGVRK